MMKLYDLIINLLFPRRCMFCNRLLSVAQTKDYCDCCESADLITEKRICEHCGVPLDVPRGELICNKCRGKKTYFVRNIARYIYRDNTREAVLKMKFRKNNQWIAISLGKLLCETVKEHYGDIKFDIVTAVPVSSKRIRKRGFNQSELIARVVAKNLGVPFVKDALVKFKDNKKQSGLDAKKRQQNVKGVYKMGKVNAVDKTVLLIDDVYTTGATVNECSRILKKGGALLVYCATACVTRRGSRFWVSKSTLEKLKR